jgi:gamma-glutamylcyclotransferase (GGCT)/AIG2-like uncharacterized protein YtfP
MTLYFAYGANMARAPMALRCRGALALGCARLDGWRFVITIDGYASVAPRAGAAVHGVLWRLTPRDLAALNTFESLDSGLYRRTLLTVRIASRHARALVYVGRGGGEGRPKPGYLEAVLAAARDWDLPPRYVGELKRWASSGYHGARPAETGEVAAAASA